MPKHRSVSFKSLYCADRVYLWCAFESNPIIVLIGSMNTQRNAERHKEEIANAGVPPRGEQVPPPEEDAKVDQAPVNRPPLTDENIRNVLIKMAQSITTQSAQANLKVVPRPHKQVTAMAFCLWDFTRMNTPTFCGY